MISTDRDLQGDLDVVAAHTARLLATASALDEVDVATLCDGWTRGHVLTHIARNAEAIGRLATWATTGTPQPMYPGGTAGRDAQIEAGAGRALPELVADVAGTAAQLAPLLERLADGPPVAAEVEMRGGLMVPPAVLPFLRLREVVFHHVDLEAGFTFAGVEPDLIRIFIEDAVARLQRERPVPGFAVEADEGDRWVVGDPATRVTGALADLLLWLARRRPDGVRAEGGALPDLPRGS